MPQNTFFPLPVIGKGNHGRAEHGDPRSPSGAGAKVEYGLTGTCVDANGVGQDEVPDRGTSGRDAHRSGIVGYSRSRREQAAASLAALAPWLSPSVAEPVAFPCLSSLFLPLPVFHAEGPGFLGRILSVSILPGACLASSPGLLRALAARPIKDDTFPSWCRQRGMTPDVVDRQLPDGQGAGGQQAALPQHPETVAA